MITEDQQAAVQESPEQQEAQPKPKMRREGRPETYRGEPNHNASRRDGPYKVKLPTFEGPLDLLLSLIKENKIDIYDIPIAFITHQYLQYIELMKELNLTIAGEFLLMAATLIHIKSRMLLPVEERPEEDEEDPRLELVQMLLEYQSFREAALGLRERETEWEDVYFKTASVSSAMNHPEGQGESGMPGITDMPDIEVSLFNLNLYDLLSAFRKVLEKVTPEARRINRETLTIKDKIAIITGMISKYKEIAFEDLFEAAPSKVEMIITFLALLELLKLGLVKAWQKSEFAGIRIGRGAGAV
jgi:segregation and condensation protein A